MSTSSREDRYRQTAEDAWASYVDARFQNLDLESASSGSRLVEIELDIMQKYLAIARQKRNALCTICKLAPEVLVNIFQIVKEVWAPHRLRDFGQLQPQTIGYDLGWILLTHVCSKWRQAAVADSTLWTEFDCFGTPPLAFYTIISRSQGNPLKLRFQGSAIYGDVAETSQRWLRGPLCTRITALEIDITQTTIALIPSSFPGLLDLSINFLMGREPISPDFPWNLAPSLTRLQLNGSHATPWDSPIFVSSLVHLSWRRVEPNYSGLLPLSKFSSFLARMPQLRTLYLQNVLAIFPEVSEVVQCSIPSALESLQISDYGVRSVAALFKNMSIPATTSVFVDLIDARLPESVNEIAQSVFRGADMTQKSQELMLGNDTIFVRPWRTDISKHSDDNYHIPFSIDIDDTLDHCRSLWLVDLHLEQDDDLRASRDLSIYLPCLPLQSIAAITLSEKLLFMESADSWNSMFSVARDVRCLYMPMSDHVTTLCAALEEFANKSFVLFPKLNTVILGRSSTILQSLEHIVSDQSSIILSLESMLRKRRVTGFQIRQVHVLKEAESWPGTPWIGVRRLVQLSFFE